MSKADTKATEQQEMFTIEVERDGEVFERQVTIRGIPLWIPQKSERGLPLEIVGDVFRLVVMPPNEEAGFPAREAMIVKTKSSHWAVPIDGPVLQRQFLEQNRTPRMGDRVLVSFDGKAKKASRAGWAPANLYSLSWISKGKTAELAKKLESGLPATARAS